MYVHSEMSVVDLSCSKNLLAEMLPKKVSFKWTLFLRKLYKRLGEFHMSAEKLALNSLDADLIFNLITFSCMCIYGPPIDESLETYDFDDVQLGDLYWRYDVANTRVNELRVSLSDFYILCTDSVDQAQISESAKLVQDSVLSLLNASLAHAVQQLQKKLLTHKVRPRKSSGDAV